MDDRSLERQRLVRHLRHTCGVHDEAVLGALGDVPRHEFVPAAHAARAYLDEAVPLGRGQTVSQPCVVALMTEALELAPNDVVLEVGTGSGYQAAVLRRLCSRVVTVERDPVLADGARDALARTTDDGDGAVDVHVGDGSLGRPEDAPFDAVVVTAAAPRVPAALLGQLADDGRLVAPVGPRDGQTLVRVRRRGDGWVEEDLGPVAFVPLVGEGGWPD